MSIAVWMLDTICTVLEALWIVLLADTLLPRRFEEKKSRLNVAVTAGIVVFYTVFIRAMNSFALTSGYTAIAAMFIMILITTAFWKADLFLSASVIGVFFLVLTGTAVAEITVTGWIGGEPLIQATTMGTGLTRCVYLLICGAITALANGILRKCIRLVRIRQEKSGLLLVLTIGTIGFALLIQMMLESFSVHISLLGYSIIATAAASLLFAYYYLRRRSWLLERQELESRSLQTEEKYLKIQQDYTERARTYHDISHHLHAIYTLAREAQDTGVVDYVKNIMSVDEADALQKVWTGVDIIDCVLNEEYQKGTGNGLSILIDSHMLPMGMRISNKDLCSLFANILDNAIDAAKTRVEIHIRLIHEMVLIQVENDTKSAPVFRGGKLVTTKSDKKNHGWGTRNIEDIVNRYDGSLKNQYRDGVFSTEILVNI